MAGSRKKADDKPVRPIGRPPVIRGTDHQELVDRCLAAGWTSEALSLYLRTRYAKTVEASTIRRYWIDEKDRIRTDYADLVASTEERVYVHAHRASDQFVDTLGNMAEMIRLQRERLEIGLRLEQQTGAFLIPDNRHEIKLLHDLLSTYHRMLQDWGVIPVAGMEVRLDVNVPSAQIVDQYGPVIDLFDADDQENVIALARKIHDRVPMALTSVT